MHEYVLLSVHCRLQLPPSRAVRCGHCLRRDCHAPDQEGWFTRYRPHRCRRTRARATCTRDSTGAPFDNSQDRSSLRRVRGGADDRSAHQSGQLVAIGETSPKRLAALPDVPTVAEQGYPGFQVDNMYGVLAPHGTPPAVVAKLHADIVRVVQLPDAKKSLEAATIEHRKYARGARALHQVGVHEVGRGREGFGRAWSRSAASIVFLTRSFDERRHRR